MNKIYAFEVTQRIADDKGVPTRFSGSITRRTDRAIYIVGIGELKSEFWFPKSSIVSQKETGEVQELPKEVKNPVVKKSAFLAGGVTIGLKFDYDVDLVSKVRAIQGRKWSPDGKFWTVPLSEKTFGLVSALGFDIDPSIAGMFEAKEQEKADYKSMFDIEYGQGNKLLPFQVEGAARIYEQSGRMIVGDEQGLGKTVQCLAYLKHADEWPALVVCPASMKFKWAEEARKWIGEEISVKILSGKKPEDFASARIIIANYNIIQYWTDVLKTKGIKAILLDEVQKISEDRNQCTKAIKMLAKGVPHVIPISGTPAKSRPIQLYNAIRLVDPNLLKSRHEFGIRYCKGFYDGFGWNFKGASNVEELHEKLEPIMLRRLKSQVMKDLPSKIRGTVPTEINNRKEYQNALNNFLSWVKSKKGDEAAHRAEQAEAITKMGVLRYLAAKGALKESIEWIEDFLSGGDEKLIVFAIHKDVISALMERFGDIAVKIDGSVPTDKRNDIVHQFQENPEIRLFVGNIKAAGEGITLTAACNVAFLELPWTPGDLMQAEDRAHRIGQTSCVNVWYLVPKNTIAEHMAEILSEKTKTLTAVIDGEGNNAESDMLSRLLDSLCQDEEEIAKAG